MNWLINTWVFSTHDLYLKLLMSLKDKLNVFKFVLRSHCNDILIFIIWTQHCQFFWHLYFNRAATLRMNENIFASDEFSYHILTDSKWSEWTVTFIKQLLKIDENTYISLNADLKKKMIRLRLLSAQLKIHINKCKLQKIFQEINDKYKTVFENILESQRSKCLTIMTQWCNNNKKQCTFQETHETE